VSLDPQISLVLQEQESCQAAGFGSGATGTATTPLTIVEQCNNGIATQISSTPGTINTSQCFNSAGGQCVPISPETCSNLDITDPDPICQWTQAELGLVQEGSGLGPPPEGWFSDEFKSVLTWKLAPNLCSCLPTPTAVGQITPGGSFAQFSTGDVGPAPTGCPNADSTCTVLPLGACN